MKSVYPQKQGATSTANGGGVRPIGSALKTLALLDLLGRSEQPMRLAELARAVGGGRATVYQKLVTLLQAGWIEQTAQGAYRLSLHAARIGEAALRQANLGERSRLILEELVAEAGETASLAVINGIRAELVQRVEAEVVVRVERRVGTLLSLDQSASGRVLTAFATDAARQALQRKGAVLAPSSALRDVRRKGYAFSTGRDVPGVKSVAVPVLDAAGSCLYALSVVAPVSRFDGPRYVKPLLRAAARLHALVAGTGVQ
jgi:DNA-binding IclR family transcriptional regulator